MIIKIPERQNILKRKKRKLSRKQCNFLNIR